jgi:hypothetical protein
MCLFRIEREDLPRHFTIGYNESGDRFCSQSAHGFQPVSAVRSPESMVGRCHSDDRIKKTPRLVNDIREPLVMGVR